MSKPVAWALITKHGVAVVPDGSINQPKSRGYVPLYTYPVKELTLTDEDILEEWTCKYSDCYQDTLINFARAILRKANEK